MPFHQTQPLQRRELQDGSQQRKIDAVLVMLPIMLCFWHPVDHVAILTHAPAARQGRTSSHGQQPVKLVHPPTSPRRPFCDLTDILYAAEVGATADGPAQLRVHYCFLVFPSSRR